MDADAAARRIAELEAELAQARVGLAALARDGDLLGRILDHIPVMICCYTQSGEVLLLNRAFEEMLGYSLAEARAGDVMALCYPDPAYRAELWEFMTTAHGQWRDVVARTKSGEDLPSSWTNVALQDGSQIGIGIDLRDRLAADADRRRLDAEVASLLTRVIDGFIPICANCKSVRTRDEEWVSVETYIMARSEAEFTHGLCPGCCAELYPDLDED